LNGIPRASLKSFKDRKREIMIRREGKGREAKATKKWKIAQAWRWVSKTDGVYPCLRISFHGG